MIGRLHHGLERFSVRLAAGCKHAQVASRHWPSNYVNVPYFVTAATFLFELRRRGSKRQRLKTAAGAVYKAGFMCFIAVACALLHARKQENIDTLMLALTAVVHPKPQHIKYHCYKPLIGNQR
jgi:hypothetical protein